MAKSKSKKKKIIIFTVIGVLLLAVVLLAVFSGNGDRVFTVETAKAEKRTITQTVNATGKIFPIDELVITSEVTGEIVELPIKEGDKVEKGQLLIRMKPDIYIAQKKKAEANLISAQATLKVRKALLKQFESDFNRTKSLYEKKLTSDSELERSQTSYLQRKGELSAQEAYVAQAKEALNEAKEQLAKTAIHSPISGTVSILNVELGERVLGSGFSNGTNLMTVANLDAMEARVDVDENDVVLISVNDTAKIDVDAFGDKEIKGIVTHIGNSAKTTGLGTQSETVNFEVKIKVFTNGVNIRPGMSCDTDIRTETRNDVISVPIQSVTARNTEDSKNKSEEKEDNNRKKKRDKKKKIQEVIFITANKEVGSVAKMVDVKTGISDDSYIEVISGIKEGDKVISGPYRTVSKELKNDSKISIKKGKNDKQKKQKNG